MPVQIEHEGQTKTFFTQEEIDVEIAGLKITNEQLKTEKVELKDKLSALKTTLSEVEAAKLNSDELAAKASGDKEALQRIADERDAKKQGEIDALRNSISSEKVENLLNQVVTELGAGGTHNEDLRDLIKSRFTIGYDMETHESKVSGEGVSNLDDLKKIIKESGRYDAYLAGSGSSGGDSRGNQNTGVSNKKLSEMTATEEAEFAREFPEKYAQMIQ